MALSAPTSQALGSRVRASVPLGYMALENLPRVLCTLVNHSPSHSPSSCCLDFLLFYFISIHLITFIYKLRKRTLCENPLPSPLGGSWGVEAGTLTCEPSHLVNF